MIDHLSTYAVDFARAQAFYDAALKPLGYERTAHMVATWDFDFPTRRMSAYGPPGQRILWLIEVKEKPTPRHVAFRAPTRQAVQDFFAAALQAGGLDNGGPGPREQYHPTYYGAFVLDPDGNNVEAVTHGAP